MQPARQSVYYLPGPFDLRSRTHRAGVVSPSCKRPRTTTAPSPSFSAVSTRASHA
nr:MAG TPA: hypothetical protein [Caudoviricetes sp.]DAK94166.1 MAG TPA: hypothetical protein [Caudoviricetes sp.]DAU32189.1 MAG TPA: hypothetical protein [Caudoviricetes sp.]